MSTFDGGNMLRLALNGAMHGRNDFNTELLVEDRPYRTELSPNHHGFAFFLRRDDELANRTVSSPSQHDSASTANHGEAIQTNHNMGSGVSSVRQDDTEQPWATDGNIMEFENDDTVLLGNEHAMFQDNGQLLDEQFGNLFPSASINDNGLFGGGLGGGSSGARRRVNSRDFNITLDEMIGNNMNNTNSIHNMFVGNDALSEGSLASLGALEDFRQLPGIDSDDNDAGSLNLGGDF